MVLYVELIYALPFAMHVDNHMTVDMYQNPLFDLENGIVSSKSAYHKSFNPLTIKGRRRLKTFRDVVVGLLP